MTSSPLFLVVILILTTVFSTQSEACKCGIPKPEMAMLEAQEVFVGILKSKVLDANSNEWAYNFEIKKKYKGKSEKATTVYSKNISCSKLWAEEGKELLVFAYLEDGLLITSQCSTARLKSNLRKYEVSRTSVLEILMHMSESQIRGVHNQIEARVLRMSTQKEVEELDYGTWTYTTVTLDKGAKDGLYPGLEMCFQKKGAIPLTVLEVEENEAAAVFTTLNTGGTLSGHINNPLDQVVKSSITSWCNQEL